ncbi:MAG: hypothetical protein IJE91_03525 [Clostridia bacterium]|nr:hypothetical protein [Clostridia bacterium]
MLINVLNKESLKIETKNINANVNGVSSPLLIPNPLTLCVNGTDNGRFNVFNLDNLSLNDLNLQLQKFKHNNKINIIYLNNVINYVNYFDEIIIPFCKQNKVKPVVKAGSTLEEMGEFDVAFKKSPIDVLEEYGVLDLEPIILSATRLEKEDLEKLGYYSATICLDLSNDLIAGNGVPQIVTMQKYNLNIMLNVRDDLFEELKLVYMLSNGIFNYEQSYANILKMALLNSYKAFNIENSELMLLCNIEQPSLKNLVLNCNKFNIATKN